MWVPGCQNAEGDPLTTSTVSEMDPILQALEKRGLGEALVEARAREASGYWPVTGLEFNDHSVEMRTDG